MFRLLALLLMLPATADAQGPAITRAFSYDATFARCTIDPARIDVTECAAFIRGAYVLNRAVFRAVQSCDSTSLNDCPVAFEDQGLPAIAARIAVTAGCDDTDAAQFDPLYPLPADHCITMISDILRDEGVVPFTTDISCGDECVIVRDVHAKLWFDAINTVSDSNLTRLRLDTSWNTCFDASPNDEALMVACHIAELADIWADLTLQIEQDN